MIHPNTELKFINPQIGHGVFATTFIPMGTIIYISDLLEIVIHRNNDILKIPSYSKIIEKYAHIDSHGNYIVSWDIAKYVNHCCNSNRALC